MSRSTARQRPKIGAEAGASWLLLLVLVVLSVVPLMAPLPRTEPSAGEFSVDRALVHVDVIARRPHPLGSTANADVRNYLVSQLRALGLDPELQKVEVPDYFGEPGDTVDLVNVMVRVPGRDPTRALALVGHYDSVPTTPGANDNAAAVAAMLETARALTAGPRLRNDVILLFTDGEEPAPRYGSVAFVEDHPWFNDVGFILNLEAAGGSGPSMVIETSGPGAWIADAYAEAVPHPVAFSYLTEITDMLGGIGTDFDPFAAAGVAGYNIAYLRDSPIYHTPQDSPDRVNPHSIGHHGSNALGVAYYLGEVDLSQIPDTGDAVYFSVARSTLIRYPASWTLPLAIVAALLFATAVMTRSRESGTSLQAVLIGAGVVAVGMLVAVVTSTVIWRIITGMRPMPGVGESYAYLGGLVLIVAGVWVLTSRLARWRSDIVDLFGGVVLVWIVLVLITGVAMEGTSYLFVWPAIGASAAMLVGVIGASAGRWLGPVVLLAVAAPALLLMVPPIETFFQMALPRPGNPDSEMVEVVSVSMLLTFLCVAIIASTMARRTARASE